MKFLKEKEIDAELIDFRQKPVNEEKIADWLEKVPVSKLFNTRSATYRDLKLKQKSLDDTAKRVWMAKENMLIKRPVLEFDDRIIVGFDPKIYEDVFG